jgi:hypothetical protein
MVLQGLAAGHVRIQSSSGGTRTTVTLQTGCSESNAYLDGVDVDSSAGQEVLSIGGSVNGQNNLNWFSVFPNAGTGARGSALIVSSAGVY